MRTFLAALLLAVCCAAQASATVSITVVPSTQTVSTSAAFDLVIKVSSGAQQVDSAGAYLDFDHTRVQLSSITPGTALPVILANTFDNSAGTVSYSAGTFSSFPTGIFTVATLHFAALTTTGTTPVTWHSSNPRKTDVTFGGSSVLDNSIAGNVVIAAPTAGPTNTRTHTPANTAVPTATRTVTHTVTPGGPTPTPTSPLPACCGDCDHKGYVSLTDFHTCTEIIFGSLPLETCPECDCDASGTVNIVDLNQVNSHYLIGCPSQEPRDPLPYAVNPVGFPAEAQGHFQCKGSAMRACMSVDVLDTDPPIQVERDLWAVSNFDGGKLCFAAGGQQFCVQMTPVPAPTP